MALTKGQKKRRDREADESRTVTDPKRVGELLESPFAYHNLYGLLSRADIVQIALPHWIDNKTAYEAKYGVDYVMSILDIIHVDTVPVSALNNAGVLVGAPRRVLSQSDLSDDILIALANAWMDNRRSLNHYYKWGGKDAAYKGTSVKIEERADRQFESISAVHLLRMKELAEKGYCAMPPVLRRPGRYYSPAMEEYRSWMEFIGCTVD